MSQRQIEVKHKSPSSAMLSTLGDIASFLQSSLVARNEESTDQVPTTTRKSSDGDHNVQPSPKRLIQKTLPAEMVINRKIHRQDEDEDEGEDEDEYDGSDSGEEDKKSQCSCPTCKYISNHYDPSVDELDKQIERKNRLFVIDDNGEMHWLRHELTYTRAEIIRRGGWGPSYMYDYASPQELRKWVRDRSLPDPYPQGLTLRYLYIRLLEQNDAARSFRFLELPAEMRNLIYAELLTFGRCQYCPRVHSACHTGILRVNKQVYKEARDILYGDNVIRYVFGASGYGYESDCFVSIMHVKETRGQENSMYRVFSGMSQIPEYLHRIQHLRVDLDFSGGSVSEAGFMLQTCLLNLATFLMDEHSLKKLEVHITDSSDATEENDGLDDDGENVSKRLNTLIYPLRRLHGIERVEIHGVDKNLANHTAAVMQRTSGPGFNTLQHFHNLRAEAKAFAKVMEAADPLNCGPDDPPEVPPRHGTHVSNDLELLVEELGDYEDMDEDYNPFADAAAEINTRRKMEELKDCLAKLQFTEFESRKKEFLKLRKARAAYQMKSKWVYVDGKKKAAKAGLRYDWNPRLEDEYEW